MSDTIINIPSSIQEDSTNTVDFTAGDLLSSDGSKVVGVSPSDLPISDATQTELDGKIESVVAGTNVTVDNTDPLNPVISSSGGGGGVISKTYAELTALIASNGLIQGQKYLLSDYETTYTQPVTSASKSSGVTEPLILTAVSDNAFSQIAFSELHPEDIVYYEITGDIGNGKGTEGFTKGKIYRRIDTLRNNDIGTDWRYVKYDRSGTDKLLFEDYEGCYNNLIETYFLFDNVVGSYFISNKIGNGFMSNTFGTVCTGNRLADYFSENLIGDAFYSNEIGENFNLNEVDYYFYANKVGTNCAFNIISDNCQLNTIGETFNSNTLGTYAVGNKIGNNWRSNIIGSISNNTFTVGTLPTTVEINQELYVSDALIPTYLGVAVGGGAVTCKVFWNGTDWITN